MNTQGKNAHRLHVSRVNGTIQLISLNHPYHALSLAGILVPRDHMGTFLTEITLQELLAQLPIETATDIYQLNP